MIPIRREIRYHHCYHHHDVDPVDCWVAISHHARDGLDQVSVPRLVADGLGRTAMFRLM